MRGTSSSYEQFLARTWSENRLFDVLLELTYRCNLDCFYCYNDTRRTGVPLGLPRYLELLRELRELGVLHLTLSGGEPLAHPDFFAIGAAARNLGFAVRVKSNGHALRGRMALRLRNEVDPFVVDLSIHGAAAATHDRQTRVAGSFDRLMNNLKELRASRLRLKLNCTVTRWNEHEIEKIWELARELGLPVAFNTAVSPRDDGDASPLAIAPTRQGLLALWRFLDARAGEVEQRAREGDELSSFPDTGKNCGAGSSSLTVDPYGDVLPCVQWRRPVGNLHRESIREIWTDSAELRRVREITTAAAATARAIEREGGAPIDFCPGASELVAGDPLAADPELLRRQSVRLEHENGHRRALLPVLP